MLRRANIEVYDDTSTKDDDAAVARAKKIQKDLMCRLNNHFNCSPELKKAGFDYKIAKGSIVDPKEIDRMVALSVAAIDDPESVAACKEADAKEPFTLDAFNAALSKVTTPMEKAIGLLDEARSLAADWSPEINATGS